MVVPVPTQASASSQGPACPWLRADGEQIALSRTWRKTESLVFKRFHLSWQRQRSRFLPSFPPSLTQEAGALPLLCTGLFPPAGISPSLTACDPRASGMSHIPEGCLDAPPPACFIGTCYQLLHCSTYFTALQLTMTPHFCVCSPHSDACSRVPEHTDPAGELPMAHHTWLHVLCQVPPSFSAGAPAEAGTA